MGLGSLALRTSVRSSLALTSQSSALSTPASDFDADVTSDAPAPTLLQAENLCKMCESVWKMCELVIEQLTERFESTKSTED